MGHRRDHPRRHPFGLDRFASSLASRRTKPHLKPCTTAQDRGRRRAAAAPALAPAVSPPPVAHMRPGPSDGHGRPRSKGGVALRSVHGGPVDQVHRRRSTGHVSRASCLRQPGHSQLATWCFPSPSAGCLCSFTKRTPLFLISHICPSTSEDSYSLAQVFTVKPLNFSVTATKGPSLVLLHQNPWVLAHNYILSPGFLRLSP
jgi:hypothetical protein